MSDEASEEEDDDGDEHNLVTQAPSIPTPPPPVPPPPPTGASLFTFSFKGAVAITLFAQDTPVLFGNGLSSLAAPVSVLGDGWLIGGDLRQSRFAFNVSGPPLLGAASLASIELEWAGGNQITTVPAAPTQVAVINAMGMPIGAAFVPFTASAQGDESLLPRLRVMFIELNWDNGQNVLRAGQYHNLLLAMVSASGAHPAVLGYGAGQLGWRAPGITYSHRFTFSDSVRLDAALQLNRNSWNDNANFCSTSGAPGSTPPVANCLPSGVSLGESGLPQVEARLMLLGPLAETPWPYYAPTLWQLYVVGHWDQKDLSGVGFNTSMLRDSMTTAIVEAGAKVKLGPLLIATNGWVGQNAGSVFGHIFQMQGPDKPDVRGYGVWGQAGLSLSRNFTLWAFAGIDQPNRVDAIAANFTFMRNIQMNAMIGYVNGPLMASIEWYYLATTSRSVNPMTLVATEQTLTANQPSVTFAYMF